MPNHTSTVVSTLPACDIDASHGPAYADAHVPGGSSWGYVCEPCFDRYGCQLGLGRGQRLVLASEA
jgi:hypothetical protein